MKLQSAWPRAMVQHCTSSAAASTSKFSPSSARQAALPDATATHSLSGSSRNFSALSSAIAPPVNSLLPTAEAGPSTLHRHHARLPPSFFHSIRHLASPKQSFGRTPPLPAPSYASTSFSSDSDPLPDNVRPPPSDDDGRISEHEYRVRVAKACRLLIDTLPDFMQRGALDLDDLHDDSAPFLSSGRGGRRSSSSSSSSFASSPFLGQSLLRRSPWKGKAKARDADAQGGTSDFTSIYHPSIAFCFRSPLPSLGGGGSESAQSTSGSSGLRSASSGGSGSALTTSEGHHHYGPVISFSGRTIYIASAHILRHALSALFYDTVLSIETARFEGRSKPGQSWPGISPYIKRHRGGGSSDGCEDGSSPDQLMIRLRFEGMSRMSSTPHTYTVLFRYTFDRETGMISKHAVENIQPVPGSRVWAGLTSAFGVLSPCGGVAGGGSGGGVPGSEGGGGGGGGGGGSVGGGPGKWYIRGSGADKAETGNKQ